MNIRDVMTADLVRCAPSTRLSDAARLMRDHDIGDVLVESPEHGLSGIVTDRDIVIRGVAEGGDVSGLTLGDVCSSNVCTVQADASADDVLRLMRDRAIRRVVVVEAMQPVGIVSIGDLAAERDPGSVLGRISTAPPDA